MTGSSRVPSAGWIHWVRLHERVRPPAGPRPRRNAAGPCGLRPPSRRRGRPEAGGDDEAGTRCDRRTDGDGLDDWAGWRRGRASGPAGDGGPVGAGAALPRRRPGGHARPRRPPPVAVAVHRPPGRHAAVGAARAHPGGADGRRREREGHRRRPGPGGRPGGVRHLRAGRPWRPVPGRAGRAARGGGRPHGGGGAGRPGRTRRRAGRGRARPRSAGRDGRVARAQGRRPARRPQAGPGRGPRGPGPGSGRPGAGAGRDGGPAQSGQRRPSGRGLAALRQLRLLQQVAATPATPSSSAPHPSASGRPADPDADRSLSSNRAGKRTPPVVSTLGDGTSPARRGAASGPRPGRRRRRGSRSGR